MKQALNNYPMEKEQTLLSEDMVLGFFQDKGVSPHPNKPEVWKSYQTLMQHIVDVVSKNHKLISRFTHPAIGQVWIFKGKFNIKAYFEPIKL